MSTTPFFIPHPYISPHSSRVQTRTNRAPGSKRSPGNIRASNKNRTSRENRTSSTNWPVILQAWLPVALFACVFAVESQAAFGADHTSQPLHDLFRAIFGPAIDRNWTETHHIIRKTGHFLGYGSVSLALFRGFWLTLRHQISTFASQIRLLHNPVARLLCLHFLAIASTFLIASLDELHQSFLPNRTGNFGDVLLDSSGAATVQIVLFLVLQTLDLRTAFTKTSPAFSFASLTPNRSVNRRLPRAA